MGVLQDPLLEGLLSALHEQSDAQYKVIKDAQANGVELLPSAAEPEKLKAFVSDKLMALDRDKAEFCYLLLRAIDALRVIEIGTSYGVSTIYIAAALRDQDESGKQDRTVIGTEHEPGKVKAARENLRKAGLSRFVDIREGDLRETLQGLAGPIDFVLIDIWTDMARRALEIVCPHLRPGAIVVCDNTNDREAYAAYFDLVDGPGRHFRTMTLPFRGGLEMSVYCPPASGRREPR